MSHFKPNSETNGTEPPSESLASRRPDSILFNLPEGPPPMPEEQAEKLRQAAEKLRNFAKDKMQVELTYDEKGVGWLVEYIEQARLKVANHNWQSVIDLIGAFLGESMIRSFGGYWIHYETMAGVWIDGFGIGFPFNKTFKQLENGTEGGDSILALYNNIEPFQRINRQPLTPAQALFVAFAREGDPRIFISHKLGETAEWAEVKEVGERWVTLLGKPGDFGTLSTALTQVERYYVCEPDGRLRYLEGITQADWKTLPPDIAAQLNSHSPLADDLIEALREGAEALRQRLQPELKYDENGVGWMAEHIEWLSANYEKDQWRDSVEDLGAFLGECLVRNFGGRWVRLHNQVAVYIEGFGLAFPMSEIFRQFQFGNAESDSILTFYCRIEPFLPNYQPPTAVQTRLQAWVREGKQRIFIGCGGDSQTEWWEVKGIKGSRLMLVSDSPDYSVSVPLVQVKTFYVCSPDGQLLHTQWIPESDWKTLPPDILEQLKRKLAADAVLSLDQLELGKRFIEIEYGESDRPPDERRYYATRLKNISTQKIKVTRFGGYTPRPGGAWLLGNVTGDFFTAEDFKDWYEQKGDWLMPGETACDAANYGSTPVVWAYHCVTEAGEQFIAGKLLEKPIASRLDPQGYSGAHYVRPEPPRPELEQSLLRLRASYKSWQRRLNPFVLGAVMANRPPWMRDSDELNEIFRRQDTLLKEGAIVWGALVMANQLLFKPGDANCPAILVYSTDNYFDSRPDELRLIGHKVFSFKDTSPSDPELREIADIVTDEVTRRMEIILPKVFSDKEIRWTTFMVFRQHIPDGVLSHGLFPILIHPSTQAVLMVPCEFWPVDLLRMWNEGSL